MCDIGRFDYHWLEGDDRLRKPFARVNGELQPAAWHDVLPKVADRLNAARSAAADAVRFLVSAHASNEELFLLRGLAERFSSSGPSTAVAVSWSTSAKPQPHNTKFVVPEVDAPNVNGARAFGLVPGVVGGTQGPADVSALRAAVDAGSVAALYVFDPGPLGSIGDTTWIVEARASGKVGLLVVHGVLLTALARAADIVLCGASSIEKEASYTNDQGILQGTARALPAPGDAAEDWQILARLLSALGVPVNFKTAGDVRSAIAAACPGVKGLEGIATLAFKPPVPARHWLQASNPSERWKWDFMFQDLPPVKGTVDPVALPAPPGLIPLREVK
jgi:NADH dehydrogenase/NADH:ubiquinone oxidoreductase subunit G